MITSDDPPHEFYGPSPIPTPYDSLTAALPHAGWPLGKITLIAARPADGLTTLGLEAARHASALGRRVLVFSLRYAPDTMRARMLAAGARIPFAKAWGALESPAGLQELDPASRERFEATRQQIANVEIRRPGAGFGQEMFTYEVGRRRPEQDPPALVVIDSVTSMRPDPTYNPSYDNADDLTYEDDYDPACDNRKEMYKGLFFATRSSNFATLALARIPGEPSERPPTVDDLTEADDALYGMAGQTLLLHRRRDEPRYGELDVLIPATEWTHHQLVTLAFIEHYLRIAEIRT